MQTWSSFEDKIRGMASLIYNGRCEPGRYGGVDIDGVVKIDTDRYIFIEITVRRELSKVREDILKLRTARSALMNEQQIPSDCICVLDQPITTAMLDAARSHNIKIFDAESFSRLFFDFASYRAARRRTKFGSAVNPKTGAVDRSSYVEVRYFDISTSSEYTVADIAVLLKENRRIILLGEYGSGKSRCLQQVFHALSDKASDNLCYPIAIDLREAWGLKRGTEIIRRHLDDLGLDKLQSSAITALNAGSLIPLIDGFDEIGSQAWSSDGQRLRSIKAQALQGVKDLLQRSSTSGALITGRDHYFSSPEEMFSSLGLNQKDTLVLRCFEEFTPEQLNYYFLEREIDVTLPSWLPRRPLICETISVLHREQLEEMFSLVEGEVSFWQHLIDVICRREAEIHPMFDAATIKVVLIQLADITRSKASNVGPISLLESHEAFVVAVGQAPTEEASVMLQRLSCLGRTNSESSDRQFVDTYILDGLRGLSVAKLLTADDRTKNSAADNIWINPLDELGLRVVASAVKTRLKEGLSLATKSLSSRNKILGSDIIAAALLAELPSIDFQGLAVDQGKFMLLDFSNAVAHNLRVSSTYFSRLVLPIYIPAGCSIEDCVAERVYGVTAPSGLPSWIRNLEAEVYDSIENSTRIKRLNLSPAHQVLIVILKKTFFQPGSGRKEESLLRGLGQIVSPAILQKLLTLLIREGLLTKFKGTDGWVYSPKRSQTNRVKQMLSSLSTSNDLVWLEVGSI